MRATIGFAGIHLVFLIAGVALLYALGFVTRLRDLLLALGPGYLCGLAVVMPALILLLVVGLPVRLPELVATALVLATAFAVVGRLAGARGDVSGPARRRVIANRHEQWAARGAIAALALFLAIGTTAFMNLPIAGDEFTIWSYKAQLLYGFGGYLRTDLFAGAVPGPAHLDYPILQPLLESLFFRAMGGRYVQEIHAALWILFASFIWTVGFLTWRAQPRAPLVIAAVGALALTPQAAHLTAIGYADVTVASLAATGALSMGLWVHEGGTRYALLGAVLLAGGANAKNEGIVAAGSVLLAAAAATGLWRMQRWRGWLTAAAVATVGAAPWMIWRGAHGLSDHRADPVSGFDVNALIDRTDRLTLAFGKLGDELANQGAWLWLAPCFLAVALTCVVTGVARRLASFYLASATLMFLGLLWIYWVGTYEIASWLQKSADRVVTGVVFVSAVGLAHLAATLLAGSGSGPYATSSGSRLEARPSK